MGSCPSCGSSRLRAGYHHVALPFRLLGIRQLLCDDCNLLYRAFSPLPPRSRKRPSSPKADTFIPRNGGINTEPRTIRTAARVDPAFEARAHRRVHSPVCPRCGAEDARRRARRLWERIVYSASEKRPYLCNGCGKSFFAVKKS